VEECNAMIGSLPLSASKSIDRILRCGTIFENILKMPCNQRDVPHHQLGRGLRGHMSGCCAMHELGRDCEQQPSPRSLALQATLSALSMLQWRDAMMHGDGFLVIGERNRNALYGFTQRLRNVNAVLIRRHHRNAFQNLCGMEVVPRNHCMKLVGSPRIVYGQLLDECLHCSWQLMAATAATRQAYLLEKIFSLEPPNLPSKNTSSGARRVDSFFGAPAVVLGYPRQTTTGIA
jgi:hypothetical protein